MKVGMLLHQDLGVDAVLEEARAADQQGFDSVWLFDHLMDFRGHHGPDGPMDSFVLMTAIGAVTQRTRLAWAMLNPSFDYPTVLAKRLQVGGDSPATLGLVKEQADAARLVLPLLSQQEVRA